MPDYQKGKIYKMYCMTGETDDVYYGGTTQSLAVRKAKHKNKTNKCITYILYEKYGDNVIIELVESFPCNSKEELDGKEGFYIKNNPRINKNIPGRTQEELRENQKEYFKKYREDNKEKLIEKKKEYHEENKEKMKEKKGNNLPKSH